MAGFIDLLPAIPPVLVAQLAVSSPVAQTLSTARILGHNDATYGTIGWIPPTDGSVFAVLRTYKVKDDDSLEANRIWSEYSMEIFIGIEHSDTATSDGPYQLLALAWGENLRQVVAANRRIYPASAVLYPQAGDVRWTMKSWSQVERHIVLGIPYFGALCQTCIYLDNAVNYQF